MWPDLLVARSSRAMDSLDPKTKTTNLQVKKRLGIGRKSCARGKWDNGLRKVLEFSN